MQKICQSCGMPLKAKADRRGTEIDGTRSETYCNLCYLNGKFQEPNLTKADMLERGLLGIENSNDNKVKKWLLKKSYPKLLNSLGRWK